MVATLFDGITRHNPEGLWFRRHAQLHGFKGAVAWRDSGQPIPYGDEARRIVADIDARLAAQPAAAQPAAKAAAVRPPAGARKPTRASAIARPGSKAAARRSAKRSAAGGDRA
jgi:hypothetical protein